MGSKTVRFRSIKINKEEVEYLKEFEEILKHEFLIVDKIKWGAFEINDLLSKAEHFMYANQKEKVDFVWQLMVLNNSVAGIGLYMNGIRTIPEFISKFKSLEYLVLSGGDLEVLPDSIGDLKSLRVLNLDSNLIEKLPNSIGNLESLKFLWLSKNRIKSLPETIGNLKSLEEVYLGFNYLNSLPESIKHLNSLRKLGLNMARIREVPEWIGDLSSLKELYIGSNNLKSIPHSIEKLNLLERLDLQKNDIKSLPEGIIKMNSLKYLGLQDNENIKLHPETFNILKSKGVFIGGKMDEVIIDFDIHKRIEINKIMEKGKNFMSNEKYDKAIEEFDKSIDLIEKLTEKEDLKKFKAKYLHLLGRVYLLQGKYDEALKLAVEMRDILESIGDLAGKANALNNIGNVHNTRGEYREAQKYYEQGLGIYKTLGLESEPNALIIKQSLEDVKEKIKRNPTNPEDLFGPDALHMLMSGDIQGAIKNLENKPGLESVSFEFFSEDGRSGSGSAKYCPKCRTTNDVNNNYCKSCGTELK